jgi:hypothetical protein
MQFDPGGGLESVDSMLLCIQSVMALVSAFTTSRSVFRAGRFEVAGHGVQMLDVLFDSGALQRSYISRDVVERNRERWVS